jgi:hypothetical protein
VWTDTLNGYQIRTHHLGRVESPGAWVRFVSTTYHPRPNTQTGPANYCVQVGSRGRGRYGSRCHNAYCGDDLLAARRIYRAIVVAIHAGAVRP